MTVDDKIDMDDKFKVEKYYIRRSRDNKLWCLMSQIEGKEYLEYHYSSYRDCKRNFLRFSSTIDNYFNKKHYLLWFKNHVEGSRYYTYILLGQYSYKVEVIE